MDSRGSICTGIDRRQRRLGRRGTTSCYGQARQGATQLFDAVEATRFGSLESSALNAGQPRTVIITCAAPDEHSIGYARAITREQAVVLCSSEKGGDALA